MTAKFSKAILLCLMVTGWVAGECVLGSEEASSASAAASAPKPAELEQWLAGLDSDFYAERERATDAMLGAGEPAVTYLRRAAVGDSLEAADRAVWVLQQLAESGQRSLQLAALEVLVEANRFPAVARQADAALAELQAEMCRDKLDSLGAEFLSRVDSTGFVLNPQNVNMHVKVNTNGEEWKGEADDLRMLAKLRNVSKLTIASQQLDDDICRELAAMQELRSLILIETSVSHQLKDELNQKYPNLRVIFHSRSKLGVQFYEGQPLIVMRVIVNTPAQKAGMRTGDRILKFDGKAVETFAGLTVHIAKCPPGKRVPIVVDRDGEEVTLSAELGGTDWWEELKDQP